MTICSYGHDEVCYEERKCPLCEAILEADRKDNYISELKDRIGELENHIEELEAELEKRKNDS